MAQVIDNDYARKKFPDIIGLTFIPKFWNQDDEDLIWVDCVEKPEHSGFINYLFLDSWRIEDGNKTQE
jgi:hypothetical protein